MVLRLRSGCRGWRLQLSSDSRAPICDTYTWYTRLMATVPVRELSHHTARSLAMVKAGESVDITERGKVIGRIVPVDASTDVRARLLLEGRIRAGRAGGAAMLAGVRRRLSTENIDADDSASSALDHLREAERY